MASKTITVSNVKQRFNDQWIDYKPGDQLVPSAKGGYSLKVGYNTGQSGPDGKPVWENYYVNDAKLFSYFEKGATLTIEYTTNKSGFNVIKGVAPQQQPQAAPPENRDRSIRLQAYAKAWAQVQAGNHKMTPAVFAADVLAIDQTIEDGIKAADNALIEIVKAADNALQEMVGKAKAELGATEVEGEEEEFGF